MPVAPGLSRRELLTRTASVVVSQALLGCGVDTVAAASASGACVLTAALTQGPYFVDVMLNRSDIRTDPTSGVASGGVPLALTFRVSRVASGGCTPLTGAYLDVWHCDSGGAYSDVSGAGSGQRFLRGYQVTDGDGVARFTTVYPGWYQGRAVHIHFKLRLFAGATKTYEFTSQFFFDDSLTDTVYTVSPYSSRGRRSTRNSSDGFYKSLSTSAKGALTLQTTVDGSGYAGVINLDVNVGEEGVRCGCRCWV
jgi:protocatechuate 3,4-dioxygenase beta subunit